MKTNRFVSAHGFTLIELLIVVIIAAILAAIVIPQFNNSSQEAKESALDSNLQAVRSAMELYKLQHNGFNPGAVASSAGTGCAAPGAKGTGAAGSGQAFIDQLVMASDAAGNTCSIADATYKYGPYLKTGMPAEPVSSKGNAAADIVITATGAPIAPTAATGGWATDTKSGQFVANSNAADSRSKLLFQH